jgi:heptosyltransferase III
MKLLVVRRDNIGDLVCTTPLFAALRQRFPQAWIGALVNHYNAPVLERNPDLSEVIAYRKLKHLEKGESSFAAIRERLASLWRLRRSRLDYVILATPDFVPRTVRLARWLAPRYIAGFSDGSPAAKKLAIAIRLPGPQGGHEVERVFALARCFGVESGVPPLRVTPDPLELARGAQAFPSPGRPRLAVHISARRPLQRWPAERFAALIERLWRAHGAHCMLLWSPGPATHPQHPGDDEKAKEIAARLEGRVPLVAYRTDALKELIGALAACDMVICSDGGAMHLAAALGKPIVCFFGDSPPERWRPWGVAHRVLRPASGNAADIPAEQVLAAFASLSSEAGLVADRARS